MKSGVQQVDMNWKNYSSKDASNSNKRSRITRACDICRRKKIKCDISDSQKCATCNQYGWECTFNDTTKKRGPPKGYIESLETRLQKMEALLETMQPEKETNTTPSPDDTTKEKTPPSSSVEMPKSVEHSKVVKYLGSSSGYYLVRDILSTNEEDIDEVKNIPNKRKQSNSTENDDEVRSIRFKKINVLDDDVMFVRDKTLAEHVDQLETDKLDLKNDFTPKALLTQLIYKFFEREHNSLPVVNKVDFLDAYEGRTKPPPATILIYAICTNAVAILPFDDPVFTSTGIQRDELFNTLLDHTTSLVRKEYLTPRLATIQALVLLCAYPACDKSFYRNWLRAGMAVRMAQEIGLHRTLEKLELTDEMFEMRKRIWYCTYITDRWCCAAMGRPLAIADADCDIDLPDIKGGKNGTKDYTLFVNFIKLSGILGEVLRRIYSPKAKSQGYNNTTIYHTVQSIYLMLNNWLQQVPEHHRISSEEAKMIHKNNIVTNKIREAGPLMICYYVVIVLLYRTFLVSNKSDVLPALFEEANQRCTEAANSVIDIARLLPPAEIVNFGWNFAGYPVFQASLIHVYNCTSNQPEVANKAHEYVKICIEECIEPMNKEMKMAPQAVPLIKTLMTLIGAEKKENEKLNSPVTTNLHPPTQPQQQQPEHQYHHAAGPSAFAFSPPALHPSPMSVHAIVSDWNEPSSSSASTTQQEPFVPQNVSSAAWQSLFSSAGTPFFENDSDWQTTLSSLFDDAQIKQTNNFTQ